MVAGRSVGEGSVLEECREAGPVQCMLVVGDGVSWDGGSGSAPVWVGGGGAHLRDLQKYQTARKVGCECHQQIVMLQNHKLKYFFLLITKSNVCLS